MGRWFALLSVAPSLLLGCQTALPSCEAPAPLVPSEYALVTYRLVDAGDAPAKVEISDTETYRSDHGKYSAAALRLPDACLSASGSSPAGAPPLLPSPCGPWVAELERALTSAGFRVLSWDALIRLEREKSLSTYSAAKELGADVVFVFNGLEAGTVTTSSIKLPKHEYFHSDEHGGRGEPLELDEQTRSAFLKYVSDAAAKSIEPEEIVAVTSLLDSTAIVTLTGESIWFYRRAETRPTTAKRGLRFLFGRREGGGWTPAAPALDAAAPPEPLEADAGAPGGAGKSFDKEQLELIRAGADDLVQAFKSGELAAKEEPGTDR